MTKVGRKWRIWKFNLSSNERALDWIITTNDFIFILDGKAPCIIIFSVNLFLHASNVSIKLFFHWIFWVTVSNRFRLHSNRLSVLALTWNLLRTDSLSKWEIKENKIGVSKQRNGFDPHQINWQSSMLIILIKLNCVIWLEFSRLINIRKHFCFLSFYKLNIDFNHLRLSLNLLFVWADVNNWMCEILLNFLVYKQTTQKHRRRKIIEYQPKMVAFVSSILLSSLLLFTVDL